MFLIMRHLKGGGEYVTPNVSLIAGDNSVMFNPVVIEPITFYVKDNGTNIIYEFTLPIEYKNIDEYIFGDDGNERNQLMSNNYNNVFLAYNNGYCLRLDAYYYLNGMSNGYEHPIKNYTYTTNSKTSVGDPL